MSQLIRAEIDRCPLLSSLLRESGLKVVDIGGRGKAIEPNLAPYTQYFVSEPAADEAKRLEQQIPADAPWKRVVVMPEAIASTAGEADLFVTRQPGMSSLLEPDPTETNRFYLSDYFRIVDRTKVRTITLDSAATTYGFTDADQLKLDTQGTELDILRSGAALLPSLLAVLTESNFRPFYKGQAVFADIDAFLRTQGFSLVTLDRTALRRAGFDASRYSKRVVAWAHCTYFREPDTLSGDADESLRRRVPRYLALALASEHFDLAQEMVRLAKERSIYGSREIEQLEDEVNGVIAFGTTRMLKKAQKLGIVEEVMSASARDRRRLGG